MDLNCRKRLLYVWGWIVLINLTGCGTRDSGNPDQTKAANSATPPTVTPLVNSKVTESQISQPAAQTTVAATRRPDEVWEDADGRRYLGKIPYDVFFDHPLEVASDPRPTEPADTPLSDGNPADDSATTAAVDATVGRSPSESPLTKDWASVLPAENLQSEVKSIRNFLNQKLQSVGNYNSAVTMIPAQAATLAVLAGMAIEHSGNLSWKQDAGYIRDLAAAMNNSPLKRGSGDQRRLRRHFENLADTLDRSRPSGLSEPDPERPLSDVAEMRLVMQRMEQAEQRLRTEVSESSFAGHQDLVRHEAAILSGLVRAVTTESYGFADDSEFIEYAAQIADSGQAMREAVETEDFSSFQLSVSRLAGVCQACHRDYKNN
ncbi:MAG: hypothetical protein MK110_04845 [Fuerstiella sp.]|nr:hypothetical protein [Fuerstiella sp.]